MDIERSNIAGIPLLLLAGEIGHEHAPRLRQALEAAVGEGTNRLLLDLSAVPYVDSGCLGLVWVIVESVAEPGWVGIIGANEDIRRIFQMVGLEDGETFRFYASQREARQALEPSYARG